MGLIIKNGVIYNGAESEPVVYSLDEREIGVWIDGKPLYQKVWVFNSPITLGGSFSTVANIDSTNIEDVVHVYAIHEDGTGYGDVNADPTRNNHTLLGLKAYDTRYIIKLILQYTKISDTPGSGTWTPSGVKSEHYSTNEHVVGTWIDGSTIYEKTFVFPNEITLTTDTWVSLGISLSGVGTPISSEARNSRQAVECTVDFLDDPITAMSTMRNSSGKITSVTLRYTKTTS